MFSILSQLIFSNSNFLTGGPPQSSSSALGDQQQSSQQLAHNSKSTIKSSSWRDKSLCFDLRQHDLEINKGEQLIGCFYPIEDVKGNQDEFGLIKVTNLRLIWICFRKKRVNLSIGWRTVSLVYEQNLKDSFGGTKTSLFVLTKYESTKYEFVFNKQIRQYGDDEMAPVMNTTKVNLLLDKYKDHLKVTHISLDYLDDPFEVIFKVWQAYKQTQSFRHCRSNSSHLLLAERVQDAPKDSNGHITGQPQTVVIKSSDINRLPSEEIIGIFPHVLLTESKSIRYVGTLMLSNIRLIWIDESLPMRNLSIPYIRVDSIKLKQGEKILINTHDYLGSTTSADFRASSKSTTTDGSTKKSSTPIKVIYEQLMNFYTIYKPRFGPESCDDCIVFMSHLKPINQIIGDSFTKNMATLGAPMNIIGAPAIAMMEDINETIDEPLDTTTMMGKENVVREDDYDENEENEEHIEREFGLRRRANYMNEQPLYQDAACTYAPELGLAIERPIDGCDLKSIWRIEL